MERGVAARRLLAVVYAFEGFQGGERRLVSQEEIPASKLFMVEQQLEAVPKRTLVAYGSGLLIYDDYQDARYAATTVARVAAYVAIREVAAGEGAEGWATADGARYAAVPGGLSEVVKE
ncbi:MAG TPA: hypothetical protein VFW96_29065 [Thermomicrobiales bacterium]|nr:hypothetical protein [Thermomicrobiales bacterium]